MKKWIALLLSVVLALSACAFAEESLPVTHSHKLSNVYILIGDQVLDMSNLTVELDVAGEEEPNAWRLHMNSQDGTTARMNMTVENGIVNVDASGVEERAQLSSEDGIIGEIGLTKVDGNYIVHLQSESLGHVDYAIDPVELLAKIMDQGIAGIIQLLQSLNTTAMAQGIVNAIDNLGAQPEAGAEPEALVESEGPEAAQQLAMQLPQISIEGDPMEVLMGCVSEPETSQMGGVEYAPDGSEIIIADGTYTTREFTIDMDTLCTILNMAYLNGEPGGLGDKLRETGVSFEIHGSFQNGEEEGLNQIATVTATMDADGVQQTMNLNINTFSTGEGKATAVSYGLVQGEQGFGVSFRVTTGQHEGELFTADSVDMGNAIVLTDMELTEAFGTLGESLGKVGMDCVGVLISPLLEMVKANVDVDAMRAQAEDAAAAAAE